MFCTNCGNYIKDEHNFCTECGAARPVMPATKKGTLWVPIALLALMFIAGITVYLVSLYG
jgi:hypothetical protein